MKHLRNFSFLTAGRLLGDLLFFAFFILLSRIYGAEAIGQYSFAFAFVGFHMVVMEFGLSTLYLKDISKYKNKAVDLFSEFLLARLLLGAGIALILLVTVQLVDVSDTTRRLVLILAVYQMLYYMSDCFFVLNNAKGNMHFTGVMELLLRVVIALCATVVTLSGGSIELAISFYPVVALVHFVCVLIFSKKTYFVPKISRDLKAVYKRLKEAIPYASSSALYLFYSRSDIIMLTLIISELSAGIYNAAYRIIFALAFIPAYVAITFTPHASILFEQDNMEELTALYKKLFNVSILIGIPMSVGLCLISAKSIDLLYGNEFFEAQLILQILSFLIFTTFMKALSGMFLTISENQKKRAKAQAFTAVLNVTLNIILIQKYGGAGAAAATIISEAALFLIYQNMLRMYFRGLGVSHYVLISVLGASVFFLIFTLFPGNSIFVEIILSGLVYISIILSSRKIREETILPLIAILKKR